MSMLCFHGRTFKLGELSVPVVKINEHDGCVLLDIDGQYVWIRGSLLIDTRCSHEFMFADNPSKVMRCALKQDHEGSHRVSVVARFDAGQRVAVYQSGARDWPISQNPNPIDYGHDVATNVSKERTP